MRQIGRNPSIRFRSAAASMENHAVRGCADAFRCAAPTINRCRQAHRCSPQPIHLFEKSTVACFARTHDEIGFCLRPELTLTQLTCSITFQPITVTCHQFHHLSNHHQCPHTNNHHTDDEANETILMLTHKDANLLHWLWILLLSPKERYNYGRIR